MRRYTVVLLPDEEGTGYTVEVPELPGCITEGNTVEEALIMAKDAIQGYIASMIDAGEEVPEEAAPLIVTTVEVDVDCVPASRAAG
jgi:antitoxin HicB